MLQGKCKKCEVIYSWGTAKQIPGRRRDTYSIAYFDLNGDRATELKQGFAACPNCGSLLSRTTTGCQNKTPVRNVTAYTVRLR